MMLLSSAAMGSTNNVIRFLVIGRGAMGLLHAKFLEDAGHEVALYNPCGLHHDHHLFYGVLKYQETEIRAIRAGCLDAEDAKEFLRNNNSNNNNGNRLALLSGVLVTVKAHHIQSSLMPLVDTIIPYVSSVIVLHNGLLDQATNDFLDKTMPFSSATMISSRGSTLLTGDDDEILPSGTFEKVAHEMGKGSSFIFPRTDSITVEAMAVLRAVAKDASLVAATLQSSPAFPECTLLTKEQGRLEQYLKLAVNVAVNGLLARLSLRDWCDSNGALPVRRIKNKEMLPELHLAKSIARLTLIRAAAAPTNLNNVELKRAIEKDEAAHRVETIILKVHDNVCSTVADICSGRTSERAALFDILMNEWPRAEEGDASLQEASMALEEVNTLLTTWDDHIVSSSQ